MDVARNLPCSCVGSIGRPSLHHLLCRGFMTRLTTSPMWGLCVGSTFLRPQFLLASLSLFLSPSLLLLLQIIWPLVFWYGVGDARCSSSWDVDLQDCEMAAWGLPSWLAFPCPWARCTSLQI